MDLVSKECKSLVSTLPTNELQKMEDELSSLSDLSKPNINKSSQAYDMASSDSSITQGIKIDKREQNYNYNMNRTDKVLVHSTNIPTGWCSWYHFYEKIDEVSLRQNITLLKSLQSTLPLSLVQIDDGYQSAWGDWLALDTKKFPDPSRSLSSIVQEIHNHGFKAGIWLAPFAVDKHSKIANDPSKVDWILRQKKTGIPCNSANCGKWFYGLDPTNEEVRKYVTNVLQTMTRSSTCYRISDDDNRNNFEKDITNPRVEIPSSSMLTDSTNFSQTNTGWGFKYVKLDFLYAAGLKAARKDPTINCAQAVNLAMETIHTAVGKDVFILGCGMPIGSGIGYVHANRVSADAGPSWLPEWPLPNCKWNLPCARNMVRNSINRLSMHGRWWINDPDCMLIREGTNYSSNEFLSIATVKALSGGSLIISDNLEVVSQSRLEVIQQLLPVTGRAAVAIDLLEREIPELLRLFLDYESKEEFSHDLNRKRGIDSTILLGVFNWDNSSSRSHQLPLLKVIRPFLEKLLEVRDNVPGSRILVPKVYMLHCYDFWNQKYDRIKIRASDLQHKTLNVLNIETHSTRLLSLRLQTDTHQGRNSYFMVPQYIGSNIHFSCGMEVASFDFDYFNADSDSSWKNNILICLSILLKPQKQLAKGKFILLYLPGALPSSISAEPVPKQSKFYDENLSSTTIPPFDHFEIVFNESDSSEGWHIYKLHLPEVLHHEEGHLCQFTYQVKQELSDESLQLQSDINEK